MKLYAKILGIVSFIGCLGIVSLIIYAYIYSDPGSEGLWVLILLAISAYAIMHFIIIHQFGFNVKRRFYKQTNWGEKATGTGYFARLLTKYNYKKKKILYQFYAHSRDGKSELETKNLIIKFFDEDGFFIDEIVITDCSKTVTDSGKIAGINSNTSKDFQLDKYRQIADWKLIVK